MGTWSDPSGTVRGRRGGGRGQTCPETPAMAPSRARGKRAQRGTLARSLRDPCGKLAGTLRDGSRTIRGLRGGGSAVRPSRRPRRWRGTLRCASALGGCAGRRAGPRRRAGAWNESGCTHSWLNLSGAFTRTRPGREPCHRRCTLTDSGIRALIVNFDATIAKSAARRAGGGAPSPSVQGVLPCGAPRSYLSGAAAQAR